MNILSFVLPPILLVIGVSFTVLKPPQLRKFYPGWEFIEAKMWNSTFLRQLLLVTVGRKGYDERYAEWVENSKYGGLSK